MAAGELVEFRKKPFAVAVDDGVGVPWVVACLLEAHTACVMVVTSAVLFNDETMPALSWTTPAVEFKSL